MRNQRGFTLIELMIVIAILGLLTIVGLPAYRDSIRQSNRADAQITLSRLATLQERHFFRTNAYTDDFADLIPGAVSGDPIASDEGNYSIAVVSDGTSWSMTATAVGAQADDTSCASLTLDNLGRKTAKKSDNSASTECW